MAGAVDDQKKWRDVGASLPWPSAQMVVSDRCEQLAQRKFVLPPELLWANWVGVTSNGVVHVNQAVAPLADEFNRYGTREVLAVF